MVTEAIMGRSLQISAPFLGAASGMSLPRRQAWRTASPLVSDWGDDHEMTQEFGNSLARAGDRVVGFAAGAGILAIAWAVWMLI
jgi:hypothetical protein